MADRLRLRTRQQRPAEALTAAARILRRSINDQPAPEDWAPTAWSFRNNTGELRHAETWLGNSMSRARLVAARRERPGAEPEPLPETHPASEAVAQLAGGVGGQSALLRAGASYLMTPGVGYLCGFDPKDGGRYGWQFRDALELRLTTKVVDDAGRPTWEMQVGDRTEDWLQLGPAGLAVKVWRPHPQRHWKPDSPVYGALDILEELRLLTASIKASATSRLAGAGLLPLPAEMEFESSWEKFIEELLASFVTPIADRGSTAAVAPFPLKVPGQWLDKIKPVQFHTAFDEHALELRQELINRLGTTMDMPVRALTGEQENHWGKAVTADEGLKLHVTPNLELLCDAITRGYLLPALATGGQVEDVAPADGRLLLEATPGTELVDAGTGQQIVVWYDLSDFAARPDKSTDATQAYDRIEISGEQYRQETGLSDGAPPDSAEFNRRIWLKIIDAPPDPELARKALVELGVIQEGDVPPATGAAPGLPPGQPDQAPAEPAPPALPAPVPATGPGDQPPSQRDVPEAADANQALVAACDALVYRALERAGNRLRQVVTRRMPGRRLDASWDIEPTAFHTLCHAAQLTDLDQLLAGAWDRVPEIAGRLDHAPGLLAATLDDFTRHLITDQHPYSWDLLAAYLAAAMSPAQRVLEAAGATQ